MKSKHQNPDGSFPRVKLLFAEKQECDYGSRAYLTARAIAKEYEEQEKQSQTTLHFAHRQPTTSATAAYYAHYEDLRKHLHLEDLSRVDAMIALRMRVTGHSPQAVQATIETYAPTIRAEKQRKENRNWQDYAERTVKYAFGVAGDVDLLKYEGKVENWRKVEHYPHLERGVSRLSM